MRRSRAATGAGVAVSLVLAAGTGCLALGASVALAAPAHPAMVRAPGLAPHALPAGTQRVGSLPAAEPLSIDLVFRSRDPAGESALLASLYEPGSPNYHHWLAPGVFATRFGPLPAEISALDAWLKEAGIGPARVSGLVAHVASTSSALGGALGVSFARFRERDGSSAYSANGPPSLPAWSLPRLDAVEGLDSLVHLHPHLVTRTAAHVASTPEAIGDHYGIGNLRNAGLTGKGQTIGVYELAAHSASDVSNYERQYAFTTKVTTVKVDGGAPLDYSGGGTEEADLDIEVALTEAPGSTVTSYEGPQSGTGPLDIYNTIVQADVAKVVSTSWGACEADYAPTDFSAYDSLFRQAAAQGQGNYIASGDSGSEDCFFTDNTTGLSVDYPGSDPYVTDVGGTTLGSPDSVWNACLGAGTPCARSGGGGGGGGNSRQWTMPGWQTALDPFTPSPANGACKTQCRGVPDVAADADPQTGYEIFYDGGTRVVGGTSAAAPLVAGIAADIANSCSAPPGDISPALYAYAAEGGGVTYGSSFTDVVSGNNDVTDTNHGQFAAGTGFDLASGIGTPIATGWACPQVTGVSPQDVPAGTQVIVSGSNLAHASIFFGSAPASVVSASDTSATVTVPSGSGSVPVSASTPIGTGLAVSTYAYPGSSGHDASPGYWMLASSGTVYSFGSASPDGSATFTGVQGSAVSMAGLPGGGGYWVVSSLGDIQAFGSASFYALSGSPTSSVVALVATPDGKGYWVATSSGQVLTGGDAAFHGSPSASGLRLNGAIVAMAASPDGGGYWLLGSDGGVFCYGSAGFYGSTGSLHLVAPAVALAPSASGGGYWFVASDGGVFAFGDAGFYGSMGGRPLNEPVIGMVRTASGSGYWLAASDGGVFAFGDATFVGSLGGSPPLSPIVSIAGA